MQEALYTVEHWVPACTTLIGKKDQLFVERRKATNRVVLQKKNRRGFPEKNYQL